MIGQSAPTSDVARFVEQITGLARRVRELELTKRPFIQAGTATGTSDANGDLTVTFPVEFPVEPVVVVTRRANITTAARIMLKTKSTTGFEARIFDAAGTAVASTTYVVEWQAIVT